LKCKDKSLKREGGLDGKRGTVWFLWKEGVKPSRIVSYLQFVMRENLDAALCLAGYGASKLARKVHRQLSMSSITAPVKTGS